MSRLFHDGFETGRPTPDGTTDTGSWRGSLWQHFMSTVANIRSIGVSTARAKNGQYSLRFYHSSTTAGTNSIRRDFEQNIKEHYGRAEVNFSSVVGTQRFLFFLDEHGANVGSIGFSQTGDYINAHLNIGTLEVEVLPEAFSRNTWVRLEWRLKIDELEGVFEVLRNGDLILEYNGNTKGATSGNGTRWFGIGRNYSSSNNADFWVDDVAINDPTGAVNHSWVGKGSVLLYVPTGAGHYKQWASSDPGLDNWQAVGHVPDSGSNSFVTSGAPDQVDTYMFGAPFTGTLHPTAQIRAVQHIVKGRYEGAEAKIAPVLRLDGADHESGPLQVWDAFAGYAQTMFNTSPFTSEPWEVEEIATLEAGIKHKAIE